jgi:hypothetical protein
MRRDPRYPASIPCWLETDEGPAIEGTIVDISLGGAGIQTRVAVPGSFRLVFEHHGEALKLPCVVRHSRDLWSNRRIHAQFAQLDPDQLQALQDVIDDLRTPPGEQPSHGVGEVLRRLLRR